MTNVTLRRLAACVVGITFLALGGCSSGSSTTAGGSPSGTVVVWDYYGQSTPIKPAIAAFQKAHPEITVKYEAFDYDTMQEKFSVAASSGDAPDLATLDMTWVPTYAANGMLADLSKLSAGTLNGRPFAGEYSAGANQAMTYQGHTVVALYDYDAYALYYRRDILAAKHLSVPTTWDQVATTAKAMSEDRNGDGKPDRYAFQVLPDTFHYAQLLFQNGGTILDGSGKHAAFAGQAGASALATTKRILDSGGGLYWGDAQGDATGLPGINDERIGMFVNGPYMMGVLRTGAAGQSGRWAVAPAPTMNGKPGSYLGGTGLAIPESAHNPTAAWLLTQFLLQPAQQELLVTTAGAAPATLGAQSLAAVRKPDPYFGNQVAYPIFSQALASATPFPYVAQWPDIDKAISDAVTAALLGKGSPQGVLQGAARTTDTALGSS